MRPFSFTLWLCFMTFLWASEASATAAFARQTGEPCSSCHMESYGPYLTPNGRLFKLNGYQAGHANVLPDLLNGFSGQVIGSFTNTQKGVPGGAAPGFSPNNNFANDWDALYFTGRVIDKIGAWVSEISAAPGDQYPSIPVADRSPVRRRCGGQRAIAGESSTAERTNSLPAPAESHRCRCLGGTWRPPGLTPSLLSPPRPSRRGPGR